jgi:protein phosphatase
MCTQLTADHSALEEVWSEAPPAAELPGAYASRSQLLGASGGEGAVPVDLFMADAEAGDVFVLCSDGLSGAVTTGDIAEWASAVGSPAAPTVVDAAEELVDLALEAGASDNVTVLVVKVTTGRAVPAAGARRPFFRRDRLWHASNPNR